MISSDVLENRRIQRQWEEERMAFGRDKLFLQGLSENYDLPYWNDTDDRHTLDVIRPAMCTGKLPVIIEIHGGGYIACEKNINRLHARSYAQQGFAVVNGDYTLHPEGNLITELREIAAIVNWIAEHDETYGFDTDKVYMSGDSAGGHLVLLYAMLQGNRELCRHLGVFPGELEIRATAATCPAIRLNAEGDIAAVLSSFVRMMYPQGVTENYLSQFDVLRLIPESNYPPLFIVTTPTDDLLYNEALELEKALAKREREYVFSVYESRENVLGHVFNVLYPEYAESRQANQDITDFYLKHS